MSASSEVGLSPVGGRARIDVLDILRGLAILGIFLINVPYMAAPVAQFSADIRAIGWSPVDREAWFTVNLLVAGTQRCLLQFLFGAGMMVMARRAMAPEGPVAVADLYYRRNLWLLGFGLVDVFVLLWPGDILHVYALAALFLFPFRRLAPRWLVALGLGWAALCVVGVPEHGLLQYADRVGLEQRVALAEQHAVKTPADRQALGAWQQLSDSAKPGIEVQRSIAHEQAAHAGGLLPYAKWAWTSWSDHVQVWLVWDVMEAFCTMLIGVALWKWGVIQGQRTRRFYWLLLLGGYGFGLTARSVGLVEFMHFDLAPRTGWITGELARLAIGLGHLAAVNLAVRSRAGSWLLSPFKAAGRMAFSLYFLQQLVGKYLLFAPWGLLPWGGYGWAELAVFSLAGIALQLVIANLWFRGFVAGPLEWLWRSLAYVKVQPFRRPADISVPPPTDRS